MSEDAISKDIATHVRSVHFTLMAVCFVLLAAYENPQKGEIERASAELRVILQIAQTWAPNFVQYEIWTGMSEGRINRPRDPMVKIEPNLFPPMQNITGLYGPRLVGVLETKDEVRELAMQMFTFRDSVSDACVADLKAERNDLFPEVPAPKNLEEFAASWDFLSCFTRLYLPVAYPAPIVRPMEYGVRPGLPDSLADSRTAFYGDPQYDVIQLKVRPKPGGPGVLRAGPLMFSVQPIAASRNTQITYKPRRDEEMHLWMLNTMEGPSKDFNGLHRLETELLYWESPALFKPLPIPAQRMLLQTTRGIVKKDEIALGTFGRSFPELLKWSKGTEGSSFKEVERRLSDRLDQGSDSLRVFGAQLPFGRLSQIGIAVILAVQVYLALHLAQLLRLGVRASAQPRAAWIGCYRTYPALAVTWGTIVVLPSYAHWLLRRRWPDTAWEVFQVSRNVMTTLAWIAAAILTVQLGLTWRRPQERFRI